ncbi:MAG: 2-oxo acid dehydrogenase subunit E2 [Gammaproteobacteria bacterium]
MAAIEVKVPDVGTDKPVDVIEVNVRPGDVIALEQTIIVLESDKATVEVPSPVAGVVKSVALTVGDKVTQGALVLVVDAAGSASSAVPPSPPPLSPGGRGEKSNGGDVPPEGEKSGDGFAPEKGAQGNGGDVPVSEEKREDGVGRPLAGTGVSAIPPLSPPGRGDGGEGLPATNVHAGPAVRKLARELGVSLAEVSGSGPKQRVLKDDVHAYVKRRLTAPAGAAGTGLPELPVIDFAKWGAIEEQPLNKLRRVSAQNLHRSWVTIPHVTQHDEADITELEDFRVFENGRLPEGGVKLTMLAFMVKACVNALQKYPRFNSSLAVNGETLIVKQHWHIGIAVDTPDGLVVPVIRDADRKGINDIAREMGVLSKKARDRKLLPSDMQGATFSISSLGGIGGTAFTPIVNWPEVAILGVSKAQTRPVWDGKQFQPRLMLPLSLSYDHRVIDGAEAARFITYLSRLLADMRRVLL